MEPVASLRVRLLLALALPLWLLAGWLDAACHRRMDIEHGAGTRESLMHLAMIVELGVGVGRALLLELNAAAFALMFAAAISHEATMWLDIAYASSRRAIPWFEQLVHGVQQGLPWIGLVSLVLLHPGQALAALGLGEAQAEWRLLFKANPLPAAYLLAFFSAALLLVVRPFVQEYGRYLRAERQRSEQQARPALARRPER